MKIIYNRFIPFKGYLAINIFGVLFVRHQYKETLSKSTRYTTEVFNHESIHTEQMKDFAKFLPECVQTYVGGVLFYLVYVIEWLLKMMRYGTIYDGYRNISFEKEAYDHEKDLMYLQNRKVFGQWRK